jgi:hypothetical protein
MAQTTPREAITCAAISYWQKEILVILKSMFNA